ncbi:hypothetical protein Ahy_B01g051905 [Arachis hypogaea]|uniref:Protein kinase domain-containing protein n=1 Tax=Arachis hypogaea TaxID=3818 RepID=A0A445AN37_ARAHY|nr:hypothetical protein Ahy_B01g051905 [Arachis hypogaea]
MINSFYEKLEEGGYGIRYKASLHDGRQVAVKILKEPKENVEEFVNEVVIVSKISHVNTVSLLKFCYQINKQTLIYEFKSNGSLDKFTHKQLAKIYKKKKSIVSLLGTRGTTGYIAPEIFSQMYGGIFHKSDMNYDTEKSHSRELYFTDWIYRNFKESNIHTRSLVSGKEENDTIINITLVNLWCI